MINKQVVVIIAQMYFKTNEGTVLGHHTHRDVLATSSMVSLFGLGLGKVPSSGGRSLDNWYRIPPVRTCPRRNMYSTAV